MVKVNGKDYLLETGSLVLRFTLNPGNTGLEPTNIQAYHPYESRGVFQGFITPGSLSKHQYQGVNRAIDLYEGKI